MYLHIYIYILYTYITMTVFVFVLLSSHGVGPAHVIWGVDYNFTNHTITIIYVEHHG